MAGLILDSVRPRESGDPASPGFPLARKWAELWCPFGASEAARLCLRL